MVRLSGERQNAQSSGTGVARVLIVKPTESHVPEPQHRSRPQASPLPDRRRVAGNWALVVLIIGVIGITAAIPALAWQPSVTAKAATVDSGASPSLTLTRSGDYYEPRDALRVWVDPSPDSGTDSASAALAQGRFEPLPTWPPTFGFANGTYWFHLSVRNVDHPASSWLLAVNYALLDRIELFDAHSGIELASSGDAYPFAQRALPDRFPSLHLDLPPGTARDLLVRIETTSSIQVPMVIATPRALLVHAHEGQLGLGAYYGVMLGLFCYNLVLFLSLRDRTFVYYLAYVAMFALGQATLNGLSFQYLWPESPPWANHAVLVFIGLGEATMLAFTRVFLDLRRLMPRAVRLIDIQIAILVGTVLASPWLGYRNTIFVETGMVLLLAPTILIAALQAYRAGYRPARAYLIAWSALLAGVTAYALVSFGVLPKVFATEYGIQIGSAAEMILLSFALADRVHVLREENSALHRAASEQLERRVEERTRELHSALDQLQQANRVLNEFSLRDGLTGAYNRRYLERALEDLGDSARRHPGPLSVLMVDLDHFKQVNDSHGHLVGDDCLIALAQCLMRAVRSEHERVARFGGEEFAVLLPGVVHGQALERAEAMRAAIESLAVAGENGTVRITASIGVATGHATRAQSGADLLRQADRALYDAKRAGRNRVVGMHT